MIKGPSGSSDSVSDHIDDTYNTHSCSCGLLNRNLASPSGDDGLEHHMAPEDPQPRPYVACQYADRAPTCATASHASAQEATSSGGQVYPLPMGHAMQQQQQQQQGESDDDSWTPEEVNSLDEEDAYDSDGNPAAFCTNCTARLVESMCSDCGHDRVEDQAIFCMDAVDSMPLGSSSSRPVLIWDEEMLLHEEGKGVPHPERPDRLRAIMAQLTRKGLAGLCTQMPSRPATVAELLQVHTLEHVKSLKAYCSGVDCGVRIPSDTYVNEHTLKCAALAAGSAAQAAAAVAAGTASCGAAIVRPPGHHAESNTAMGFCFYNNAAVAARAAQQAGAHKVLILDWDVHHGNGTQHIFERDPTVLYMSLHRYDRGTFYPGTGSAEEVGYGPGEGFNVNVPWDAGNIGNGDYMAAFHQLILPIAREYEPSLIIISAGFDAAEGDPIGGCCVTPECFARMAAALMKVAPTVLLLEGGYNLLATADCTEACLRVLLGQVPPSLPSPCHPSPFGWLAIQAAKKALCRHWSCLAGSSAIQLQQRYLHGQPQEALGQGWQQGRGSSSGDRQHPRGPSRRRQREGLVSRKLQILRAIHKKAVQVFWRRRQRVCKFMAKIQM